MVKFKALGLFFLLMALSPDIIFAADGPRRIVSLAPSLTESLYSLGRGEELIAVTSYCNYPEDARTKEIIGTLINPNIEKIFSLSPDLILAVRGINRPQTIDKLKSLGLNVIAFDKCNTYGDIIKSFLELGKLMGTEQKAKEIVNRVDKEVQYISQKVKASPPVSVFWEVGARPLVTIGAKAFANEFIRYAGGVNVFAGTSLVIYPRVSREEVLKMNPEVIILVVMGNVTEKEKAYWQKFPELEAAKSGRIYLINADSVCRPTPLSFLAGLKKVAALLHPEAFEQKTSYKEKEARMSDDND
ncbi:MAG: cobalamin-binding protein [Candidatus Omnitrophica bacterium]|nr:cobalamin-binding protein [Candidatus Omnitrophota bacterium]